jgi:tRNA threonylcarbamoyladenosine biosynthesis protein TsaB
MHFVLVDTADARGCVGLFRDGQLLTVDPHPAEADFSSWLLPAVHRLLSQNALSLSNLDGYAVCSGPGSFTGLRVGLTTLKAWAEVCQKPIVAVSRLESLAAGAPVAATRAAPYTAAFLDARRSQVFAALYNQQGLPVEPESVIDLGNFLLRADSVCGNAAILWRTPDARLLEDLPQWASRQANGDTLERVQPPFAAELGALAHRKFLSGQTTDPISLDANYVRRSDAELLWKDQSSAVKA